MNKKVMTNLKQGDLGPCLLCSRGLMHGGDIQFFRVKIESFLVDTEAVQRQHGLEMSMGAAASLAQVMGPDQDIAIGVLETAGFICQPCFFEERLAGVWEAASEAAYDSDHEERPAG